MDLRSVSVVAHSSSSLSFAFFVLLPSLLLALGLIVVHNDLLVDVDTVATVAAVLFEVVLVRLLCFHDLVVVLRGVVMLLQFTIDVVGVRVVVLVGLVRVVVGEERRAVVRHIDGQGREDHACVVCLAVEEDVGAGPTDLIADNGAIDDLADRGLGRLLGA